jgi:hypothetical protein
MRHPKTFAFVLAGLAAAAPAAAQTPRITGVTPTAVRGTTITISGTLPGTPAFALLMDEVGGPGWEPTECQSAEPKARRLLPFNVMTSSNDGSATFSVLVPETLQLDDYTLCAGHTGPKGGPQWLTVPVLGDSGRLRVLGGGQPAITGVLPRVAYAGEDEKFYTFTVVGSGFSDVPQENRLLLGGQEVPVCWTKECVGDPKKAAGRVISARQLEFTIPNCDFKADAERNTTPCVKGRFRGSQTVQIRVGGGDSTISVEHSITLARVSRHAPLWWAAVVLGVIAAMILGLLGLTRATYRVGGYQVSLLASLFLDKASDTYSLSRFQFYTWTGAAVFGYAYLTIAWSLLQGRLEFAPLPEKLPGILAASAGTAVVIEGLNNSKPKGAGNIRPSLGDFITTGGMVVPERLQFLVWTLLGVFTFIFLIVLADPATIAELPPIPDSFLYMMGISSAGYIGGRFARKGGPIIDDVLARISSLTLEIHGRNLSANASFVIDTEDVTLETLADGDETTKRPQVVARDETAQDPTMAKVLRLTIKKPRPEWLTRTSDPQDDRSKHSITIINPDGQRADWEYSIAEPETAKVSATTTTGTTVTVTAAPTTMPPSQPL